MILNFGTLIPGDTSHDYAIPFWSLWWAKWEFTVPAEAWHSDGPSVITLIHKRLESAFERTGGAVEDEHPLAAAYDYFVFEPAR